MNVSHWLFTRSRRQLHPNVWRACVALVAVRSGAPVVNLIPLPALPAVRGCVWSAAPTTVSYKRETARYAVDPIGA
jgi:hypothetical protein